MKFISILVFFCAGAVWAQPNPGPIPEILPKLGDDTQIAVFEDGAALTAGSFADI